MADFCLECLNKINGTKYTKFDVIEEWGICEECGKQKIVVVDTRGYGLFNFIFWIFNRIELKALSFYDNYLWRHFKNLRYRYTRKQRQAMTGQIPMTRELFWECFNVAWCRYDNLQLRELVNTFPHFMKEKYDEIGKRLEDNPQLLEQEEQYWKQLRSRMVDEFGEEFVKEHYKD